MRYDDLFVIGGAVLVMLVVIVASCKLVDIIHGPDFYPFYDYDDDEEWCECQRKKNTAKEPVRYGDS